MWRVEDLAPGALGVSASRRTDIPALFGCWFERRLDEGFAELGPAGPPRRARASLRPRDVTHFTFWTKWPRPFFRVLERVLAEGFPVLWNVTLTGLGATPVEPNVPSAHRVVEAIRRLSRMVPPAAIQWRYDPVFLSACFGLEHHRVTFRSLAEQLAGHVDRVASSFVEPYPRRVAPDLAAYERESGDTCRLPPLAQKVELAGRLREIAEEVGIPFTLCCQPEVETILGCGPSGCNGWSWACRVYPELAAHRALAARPTRRGCACSREVDIGVYDTCTLGCRYSYGSVNAARARRNFARHDPGAPALLP